MLVNHCHDYNGINLRLIDAETPSIQPKFIDWTGYNNYTTIYAWLDELLERYPTILTNQLIGTSYQGRPIRAVKLSHKTVRYQADIISFFNIKYTLANFTIFVGKSNYFFGVEHSRQRVDNIGHSNLVPQ